MAAGNLGEAAQFIQMRESMREIAHAKRVREKTRGKASTDFLAFTQHTKPDYLCGWFHEELHEALDWFVEEVALKRSPRLLIAAPPRHGKSEAASRRFPAYALGRYPWLEIILWSYAADLAKDMNEDVQGIMDSPEYQEVFDTRIPAAGTGKGKRSRGETHVLNGEGKIRAAGVGGGVTGKGAHILLIDDPFKDDEDSGSQAQRDKVWNRYTSTAYTRLAPGGGVLVIQTCWHEDDLAGRLQKATKAAIETNDEDADRFRVIKFPAIAENDEPHRKKGEALHPERYGIKALRKIKTTLGSYFWSALYQQSPSPADGDIFKSHWWRYWRELPPIVRIKIYADTALKKGENNDYTVFQVWGVSASRQIYLLDQVREKFNSPELEREARIFWAKWIGRPMGPTLPAPSALMVEDKASGIGLIQSLQEARDGKPAIPVIGIPREIDKVTRARSGAPSIEAGNVFLPHPENHPLPWLSDYKKEFRDFTAAMSHSFDDQVDPTLDAIHDMVLGNVNIYEGAL